MFYEREARANGLIEHRHYVSAGGATFALHVKREGNTNGAAASAVQYFHQDNLGSIAMISDASGAVVERLAYDPWGKRRGANGTADSMDGMTSNVTRRGYTEHEHIDEMGLVNMNGRIYDPLIARFISADPFIQSPLESQSYNRYAYVMNQPMNRTDPTGYFSFGKIFVGHMKAGDKVGAAVFSHFMTPVTLPFGRGFSTNYHTAYTFLAGPNGYQIKSFAIGIVSIFCYAGAPACYAGMTYALNRGYGDGHHAARKKADIAFISATAFQIAGTVNYEVVNGVDVGADTYGRYAAQAAAGCVSAVAGGGKCGQGAVSAVFGKFASNAIGSYGGNDFGSVVARGAMTAVAGGIGAELAGGKFVNGAKTAAMGYLYNCLASMCSTDMFNSDDPRTHISEPQASPVLCNMATEGCLETSRMILGCNSAPGQSGCTNVGEERSYMLRGDNPITQYRVNPDVIINGTSPGHTLHDGYVVRWLAADASGNLRIWSAGYGTNSSEFMAGTNARAGGALFNALCHDNARAVRACLRFSYCPQ